MSRFPAFFSVMFLLPLVGLWWSSAQGDELGSVPQFHVFELALAGPRMTTRDAPARDVELAVVFRHESGEPTVRVWGFWDGDGQGGTDGDVFKVRFCPTRPGRWQIVRTESNQEALRGQREGDWLRCTSSEHPGFWMAEGRWYRRSDGSHPFIVGNTHYTFLSRRNDRGPSGADPVEDTRENRSTLRGDCRPWLKYVAARYGAYPNVWICLCNEWNIKTPSYTAAEIRLAGETIRRYLPYPTPVSVHSNTGNWDAALCGSWHDHVTIQAKIKELGRAGGFASCWARARGGSCSAT